MNPFNKIHSNKTGWDFSKFETALGASFPAKGQPVDKISRELQARTVNAPTIRFDFNCHHAPNLWHFTKHSDSVDLAERWVEWVTKFVDLFGWIQFIEKPTTVAHKYELHYHVVPDNKHDQQEDERLKQLFKGAVEAAGLKPLGPWGRSVYDVTLVPRETTTEPPSTTMPPGVEKKPLGA